MNQDKKETITPILYCNFCGKPQTRVKHLIAGPGVYICDECIKICYEVISEKDNVGSNEEQRK